MYGLLLDEIYNFLILEANMPNFMEYNENVDLIPISSIEYRDKIKGAMISLALGDAYGSYLEGLLPKEVEHINNFLKGDKYAASLNITDDTEMTIMLSESLIIHQSFSPEDIANRFIRQRITHMGNSTKEFVVNYRDRKIEWYKSGAESAGNGAAMRCAPIALINYGDFTSLKLMAGIQAVITHMDQMAIASSIAHSTGIAYLANIPPFGLKEKEDLLSFVTACGKSIKGIETQVYRTRKNSQIANLYTRISIDLMEAIEKDLSVEEVREKWGSGAYVLESLPFALFVFLKSPNDYEKILKQCLLVNDTDTVASIALTLAGAYLGFNNIPKGYINKLKNLEEMMALSDRLFELSLKNRNNNPYRRMRENITEAKSQDEIDKLMWEGIKYNKQEEFQLAVKHFEDLIGAYPDIKKNEKIKLHIIEAYEGLGTHFLGKEAYEDALRCFKKALAYDLNHPVILCDLAITYLNLDDLDRAEKYARRSVEIAPEYEIGREVIDAITSIKKNNKKK
ncbi:ADP-ribosylglycohydrolase [Natronincola peptidivorans]|uniref:ADP-ribosylglycohydrolase n=1 Tax=Natronincola peptidivorans TaxID=426128 RepID=A0A1I0D9T8_9FIRM|nr:ADP-ribosylglycohydrolase family protein [Natronincola peptidivorans]SET29045.1 ADP-ribosylglycohydrolase [Natronincola peptidivorans]